MDTVTIVLSVILFLLAFVYAATENFTMPGLYGVGIVCFLGFAVFFYIHQCQHYLSSPLEMVVCTYSGSSRGAPAFLSGGFLGCVWNYLLIVYEKKRAKEEI